MLKCRNIIFATEPWVVPPYGWLLACFLKVSFYHIRKLYNLLCSCYIYDFKKALVFGRFCGRHDGGKTLYQGIFIDNTYINITDNEEDVLIYGIVKARLDSHLMTRRDLKEAVKKLKEAVKKLDANWLCGIETGEISKHCRVVKKKQLSGVISSLSQKKIVICETFNDCQVVTLTRFGMSVLRYIL